MTTAATRRLTADDTAGPKEAINLKSPIIDEVPKNVDYRLLCDEAAFMEELVTIMLHPMIDGSEPGVPIAVNGDRVYLVPGRVQKVRRKHVYGLMKARPDIVIHQSGDFGAPESEHNRLYRQSTSRYNFDVVEDTPKGIDWLKQLRAAFTRR